MSSTKGQKNGQKFIHTIGLLDQKTKEVFTDKLRFVYVEMPKFVKQDNELETHVEQWLYVLRNLASLQSIPARLQDRIFERLFEVTELARCSPDDRRSYQDSLKYYRDIKNSLDTAFEVGMNKAVKQERLNVARAMKTINEPNDKIRLVTGLSEDEITAL